MFIKSQLAMPVLDIQIRISGISCVVLICFGRVEETVLVTVWWVHAALRAKYCYNCEQKFKTYFAVNGELSSATSWRQIP